MKVVIIKTNTCPKCKTLIPKFLDSIHEEHKDCISILTLGQSPEAMDYIKQYNIKQAPTFLIYKGENSEPQIFSGDVFVESVVDYMYSTEE